MEKKITTDNLSRLALENFPHEPLPQQKMLFSKLAAFAADCVPRGVFVLNGYAGTGKTSVTGAFLKALHAAAIPFVILAPTGRAAKVASSFSGFRASTIHKRIYRGNSADPSNDKFFLAPNENANTLFIVDEASLISDRGDNSLLSHLIRHIYSAPGCRMILIGDEAQLPPVGQSSSSAMSSERLMTFGLNPTYHTLDIPVRQDVESGIVYNATRIRDMLFQPHPDKRLMLHTRGFEDVEAISSNELADKLSSSWSEVGEEETLLITRSNKRANDFNRAIRNIVMYAEDPLQRGEKIIISKNDYYWSRINHLPTFIANGDTAEVTWIGRNEKNYGRYFVDVELRFPDEEQPVAAKLMLRSLVSDGPAIPREEMQRLYNRVMDAYEGSISHKIKGTMEDPYYNALQAKYAYCVTCHKAQGGQWKHVYIDMGAISPDITDSDFYRWLYTAVTRASQKVFFINPSLPVR